MVTVENEIRRDFTGNWASRDSPNSAGFDWDNVWDCDDPRVPGTRVCVVSRGSRNVIYGVYPNDLLGFCADPTDIAAALAEGRAPRVVATPQCNDRMLWGQTVDDDSGLKGAEIVDHTQDLMDLSFPFDTQYWLLLVPNS